MKYILILGSFFLCFESWAQCPVGNEIELDTQDDINIFARDFPDCQIIDGNLKIGRIFPPNLSNYTINNLNSLSNIVRVKGDLVFGANTNLANFEGLENLNVIEGSAEIRGGFNTSSLKGLENLDTVGLRFTILGTEILNTDNLSALSYVGESLVINGNKQLIDFSIPSLQDVGGLLSFQENEKLVSVTNMNHWKSITGGLKFYRCDAFNDLSGFSSLQSIGRSLIFEDTNNDSILTQLTALDTIGGDLRILNINISELNGLQRIKHIGGEIAYIDNYRLTRLLQFENVLTNIGSINIAENTALLSLDGLQVSRVEEQVYLYQNYSLSQIDGLSGLTYIGSNLIMEKNDIENLDGLSDLNFVGGDLTIDNNFSLKNLNGLFGLVNLNGGLIIHDNSNLTTISGLQNINPAGISALQITENANLSDCSYSSICNYVVSLDTKVNIENNAIGCNEVKEISCEGNRINGIIFYDKNGNKIFDEGETGIQNAILQLTPPTSISYTDSAGSFRPLIEDGATVTIEPKLESHWQLTTDSSSYTIKQNPAILTTTNYEFGYNLKSDIYESMVSLASEPTRCNEQVRFYLQAQNKANLLESGILKLKIDENSPVYTSMPKDDYFDEYSSELIWYLDKFKPSEIFEAEIILTMPNEQFIGEQICLTASLLNTSSGTEELLDSLTYKPTILCSYDPNDKLVIPEGIDKDHLTLLSDSVFRYTIRFQNTGNASAKNIRIADTLDAAFDVKSFQLISSSHPSKITLDNDVLQFDFENIYLPDSVSNEKESHGYITYKVVTKPDLKENTIIKNNAYIFFDFNPAIITNTTFNTMVSMLFTSIDEQSVAGITLIPNPVSGEINVTNMMNLETKYSEIIIYDIFGRVVAKSISPVIDINYLPDGMYVMKILHSSGVLSLKFSVLSKPKTMASLNSIIFLSGMCTFTLFFS